jgi:hypothetical protein
VSEDFFPYSFDRRFKPLLTTFGVRSERDGVAVSRSGDFVATFGRLRLVTPFGNVAGAHITERYAWYKAIGPRLSFVDDGLTFGTNTGRGVCVHFRERVPPVLGRRPHSALTVTVADCAGLVHALGDENGSRDSFDAR